MDDDEKQLQDAMQQEVTEIIEKAEKQPISHDEAVVLMWHCGLPFTRSHA